MKTLARLALVALGLSTARAGAADYDVAAYVCPAYQPDPRWAELGLFPEGKGEWQRVWEAVPKWKRHAQPRKPLWGYASDADPVAVERKIEAAVAHGVNVFIYDWYWYDGRPFLEDALVRGFLGASNNGKMKFFIQWANHDARVRWNVPDETPDGGMWRGEVSDEAFKEIVARWIERLFSRPNYYRIEGKPVVMVYDLAALVRGLGGRARAAQALEVARQACRAAGLGGLHLLACDATATAADVTALGVESATLDHFAQRAPVEAEIDYADWSRTGQRRFVEGQKELGVKAYFAHVSVGWDPNPRTPLDHVEPIVRGATPDAFEVALRRAKNWSDHKTPDGYPRLITIHSWNEWTAGSSLEPDWACGYGYLEAVRRVFVPGARRKRLKLAFEDDFNGPTLDTTKWSRIPSTCGQPGVADWNRYTSGRPDLLELRDSALVLVGKVNTQTNDDPRPYVQGQVWSMGKFSFTRGKIEIRAKFEDAKGAWPAFWMLPEKGRWPADGEIDILERLNATRVGHFNVHSAWTVKMKRGAEPPQGTSAPIKTDAYSVYTVEVTDEAIVWTVDGREVHRYPNLRIDERQYPWKLPNYILLDQQLGGDWVGPIDPKDLPVRVWIDWVRVYLPED